MWPESAEQPRALRSGLTTGCCATACCVAAAQALLDPKRRPEASAPPRAQIVSVKLPRGKTVALTTVVQGLTKLSALAKTRKDAGDDPDVTHGAEVFVELALTANVGVCFKAAPGVGTVTREGLALAVGEAAINPVPRDMMTEHLRQIAEQWNYGGGFVVAVGVENGAALAKKTMNPRLGIVGGLSILGTTGIVRPFSCAAYIASIHQGIDVARANGIAHIAATTGSSSEAAIRRHYRLSDMALIEMGDFVGAVLKYLRRAPVARLSICGGFGKISKLANGHLDLHSRAAAIDFTQLAQWAREQGADSALAAQIKQANTSMEALALCRESHIDLAAAVCTKAWQKARAVLSQKAAPGPALEVWVVDRSGRFIGFAAGGEP
ncbi:MAG: cobalt-precorrin-5B (C(1))-methyltransferase [Exilibacterium sp.]